MSYEYGLYICGLHFGTYWLISAMFYLIDLWCLDKNHKNWKNYGKAVRVTFLNHLFISLPVFYLLHNQISNAIDRSESDNLITILLKIFGIVNLSNLFFYVSHYILHFKPLYDWIHYQHHEFIDVIVVGAMYAHPIEHLICNVLAFVIPFILIGSNFWVTMFMILGGTFMTLAAHCDYKFLGIGNDHVTHHKLFVYNYGFGGYLDKLFGTYRKEKK